MKLSNPFTNKLPSVAEIEPTELKELLDTSAPVCLIDVREPEEVAVSTIGDPVVIPLMQLQECVDEVRSQCAKNSGPAVVYCSKGGRSAKAIEFLQSQGIDGLLNLRGGITAYAKEADASIAL